MNKGTIIISIIALVVLGGIYFLAGRAQSVPGKVAVPAEVSTSTISSTSTNQIKSMHTVTIETNKGTIVFQTYDNDAPKASSNFVKLAEKGFYNGVIFHRVIKGFMIQGGDPNTKDESKKSSWGMGGPGHTVKAEFNKKSHVRGVLSMARSQDPNSAGSQFFICHGAPSFLDNQYTAFGKLIKGDDVLEKIATTAIEPGDRPVKRVNVESIKIVPADSIK